jgi:hypothetical protein
LQCSSSPQVLTLNSAILAAAMCLGFTPPVAVASRTTVLLVLNAESSHASLCCLPPRLKTFEPEWRQKKQVRKSSSTLEEKHAETPYPCMQGCTCMQGCACTQGWLDPLKCAAGVARPLSLCRLLQWSSCCCIMYDSAQGLATASSRSEYASATMIRKLSDSPTPQQHCSFQPLMSRAFQQCCLMASTCVM